MNTKTKIAMGIAASALAVTAFTGTAIAAPLLTAGTVRPAYQMMLGNTAVSGAGAGSLVASMRRFMNQYRTADGRIDMIRMHADVAAGKVTHPRFMGSLGTTGNGSGNGSGTGSATRGGVGYRMMNGAGSGAGFGGMMGNRF